MSTEPLHAAPAPGGMPPPVAPGYQAEGQVGQQQHMQQHQAPPGYQYQPQGQPQPQPQPMYAPQAGYYAPSQGQPMYAPPQGQPVYVQQQPVYVDAQGRPIQTVPGQPMYAAPAQVVVAVPYQGQPMVPMVNEWKTDFCDMCNDMEVCCLTTWCPCIQYGYNQEMLDDSDCCTHCCIWYLLAYCVGCPCIAHFYQREKLRRKFGLKEDCGPDIFATCCCPACAICQEARELKIRNAEAAPPTQQMI